VQIELENRSTQVIATKCSIVTGKSISITSSPIPSAVFFVMKWGDIAQPISSIDQITQRKMISSQTQKRPLGILLCEIRHF
jgi:hypothetical protein